MKKYTGTNYDATMNITEIAQKVIDYINNKYSNNSFNISVMNADSFMPTIFVKLTHYNDNMYMSANEFKSYVSKTTDSLFNLAKSLKDKHYLNPNWRSSKPELISAYTKASRYNHTSCLLKSAKLTKMIDDVNNLVASYQQQIIYDNHQTDINFLFGGCELAA